MRLLIVAGMVAGLSATSFAGTVYYTDQINDHAFANASYELDANNAKNITNASFSDGDAATSALEEVNNRIMREPTVADGGVITLAPSESLVSAVYDLSYSFNVTPGKNADPTGTPHKSDFDPVFSAANQGDVTLDLIFSKKGGAVLADYTYVLTGGGFSMDLAPLIETGAGGAILAAYQNNGIYVRSVIDDASGVIFSADLSGYAGQDRNVNVSYNLKERLDASSQLAVTTVPEPATCGLIGVALLGLGALRRKRAA